MCHWSGSDRFVIESVAVVLLAACAPPAALPQRGTILTAAIQSNGLRRAYTLYLPSGYAGKGTRPLLLAFHGAGGSGLGMRATIDIEALADQHGFVVAYPDAAGGAARRTWALGCDTCTWADVAGIDDYRFVRELIDTLTRTYPIEPARIFATGVSLGGSFANDLACRETGLLAGVAVIASLPSADELPVCRASTRPISVLLMIGDADPNVPVGGGGQYDYLAADSTAGLWAARIGARARRRRPASPTGTAMDRSSRC